MNKISTLVIWVFIANSGCTSNGEKMLSKQDDFDDLNTFASNCSLENKNSELGIGLAVWDYDCENNVIFYADSLMKVKSFAGNFCLNGKCPCPLFFKPDYGIMYFVVVKKSTRWLKILYDDNKIAYVPNRQNFTYYSWGKFLVELTTGVREIGSNEIYKIKSVNGDYVQVTNDAEDFTQLIKWREGEKLKVELLFLI